MAISKVSEHLVIPSLNILVAADVIYDPILIPPLVRVIRMFLTQNQKNYCLLSQTIRQESTINLFKQLCKTQHICIELILQKFPTNDQFFDFSELLSPILIYKLTLGSQQTEPKHTTISDSKDKSG